MTPILVVLLLVSGAAVRPLTRAIAPRVAVVCLELEGGSGVDPWGSELVFVKPEWISPGPNRLYEQGAGDDIIIRNLPFPLPASANAGAYRAYRALFALPYFLVGVAGSILWLLHAPWLRAPRSPRIDVEVARVVGVVGPLTALALYAADWWWDVERTIGLPSVDPRAVGLAVPLDVAGAVTLVVGVHLLGVVLRRSRPAEAEVSPFERLAWSAWGWWTIGVVLLFVTIPGLVVGGTMAWALVHEEGPRAALPWVALTGGAVVSGGLGVAALSRGTRFAREARVATTALAG